MTKIILRSKAQVDHACAVLQGLDLSKPWALDVKKYVKRRSLNQNALYWKWVGIMAAGTGYSSDDLHEALKAKILPARQIRIAGEPVLVRSTAKLSTQEMTDYMEQVAVFAATHLGINLPHPQDGEFDL